MEKITFLKKQAFLFATLVVSSLSFTQTVSTFAGSTGGYANGTGTLAQFTYPIGIAVDASGNVYVGDYSNNRIRKITPDGVVTTLAGGDYGYGDSTGTDAMFANPTGVAVDATGNVYVADYYNHSIRKITPVGVVTTLAGNGTPGNVNGTGMAARFSQPSGVAVDASGIVYVADRYNHRICKITPAGEVTTLAGSGMPGYTNGTGTAAQFSYPYGVAVDAIGNVYVADGYNHRIRKITPAGEVTTLAGSGTAGYADGISTTAHFYTPFGVAVDAAGNVYVADKDNDKIRKITAAGVVSTVAGSSAGYSDDVGTAAQFNDTWGLAVGGSTIYVADTGNHKIRKVEGVVLGTNSNKLEDTFSLFPNPVSNQLNISTPFEIQKLVIYDVTGKQVKYQEGNTTAIDVQDLKSGFYLLEVTINDKKEVSKFIKQ